ncbi:hypothetical protein HPB52_020224 [Rhipicephalus sanguineus]|uniref:Uncharacterized protein n=1 Tax=Rhipicephalus sanguineus TaxID=34632 RepID=A0A9D4Q7P9_RHISA|nr:hypothetical protein HPB52_020224 [Rhipicephalus sanguineus]
MRGLVYHSRSASFNGSARRQDAEGPGESPVTLLIESMWGMRQLNLTPDNLPEEQRNEPPADVNEGQALER